MKKLSTQDRSALIRLASSLPQGSEERKAILAGLKRARWDGEVHIRSFNGTEDHPDFERALKWAKKISKNKRVIDNESDPSTAPFDRVKIANTRDGRLTMALTGTTYENIYVQGKTQFDRSVGGDYIVPYQESGKSYDDVSISNWVEVEEQKDGKWAIRWTREVGVRGSGRDFSGEKTVNTFTTVLRSLPPVIRKFYRR